MNDPAVMEARAELNSAQSRTEQARSAHWPVITATGSKLLSQSHRYSYDYDSEDILHGIRGEVNIFASGAIEADVRRSESEAEYYHYKVKETGKKEFVPLYLYILMHSGKNNPLRYLNRVFPDITRYLMILIPSVFTIQGGNLNLYRQMHAD